MTKGDKGSASAHGAAAAAAPTSALDSAGFTPAGPASKSVAASWMSSTATASSGGGVPKGSLYASLQSSAMKPGKSVGASDLFMSSGFTTTGPAKKSLAASWMSSTANIASDAGGVPKGSLYAWLQSWAMKPERK